MKITRKNESVKTALVKANEELMIAPSTQKWLREAVQLASHSGLVEVGGFGDDGRFYPLHPYGSVPEDSGNYPVRFVNNVEIDFTLYTCLDVRVVYLGETP